jgi:hypothetical protein
MKYQVKARQCVSLQCVCAGCLSGCMTCRSEDRGKRRTKWPSELFFGGV